MNVQGRVTGDTSQMVDFHVWDVVAVEDLKFHCRRNVFLLGPLNFCVCVFF